MHDTQTPRARTARATRFVLDVGLYEKSAAAKGATTSEARRELANISRSTEYRWMKGLSKPDWEKARDAAERLSVPLLDLFVEVRA